MRITIKENIKEIFSENFWDDFPIISCGISFICVVLFVGVNLEPNPYSPEALFKWGAPSINEIRDGYVWGIFSNNFLNLHPLFLFFTLGWLWTYGRLIEKRVRWLNYLWICISSITFVSLFEIAIFDRNAYGSGGLTSALFGFIWVKSMSEPYKWSISPTLIAISLLWIFVCIIAAFLGYLVSYGGLIGGMLWGSLLGFLPVLKSRVLQYVIPVAVLGLSLYPVLWSTGSISWLEHDAFKYHNLAYKRHHDFKDYDGAKKDYETAKSLYLLILEKDKDNKLAKENLPIIQIAEIGEKGDKLRSDGKINEARNIYFEVLKIDPNNETAKERLDSIRLDEMSEEANKLQSQRKFNETRNICLEMLKIAPNDDWARKCLDNIPQK